MTRFVVIELDKPVVFAGDVATTNTAKTEVLEDCGLRIGRLIAASKSRYTGKNPGHAVYFNGNVFDGEGWKIWWGDLDVDVDYEALLCAAERLGEPLLAAPEAPWRWCGGTVAEEPLRRRLGRGRVGAVARIRGVARFVKPSRYPSLVAVLPGDFPSEEAALAEAERLVEWLAELSKVRGREGC